MAASPEKLQGPQPTEGQSFPTVPAQGDQSKQPTKTPVAIPSKAQPLCTTLNKSRPVENRITRAGQLSKPPGYLKDCALQGKYISIKLTSQSKPLFAFLIPGFLPCLYKK